MIEAQPSRCPLSAGEGLYGSLLDHRLLNYRHRLNGVLIACTLPELLLALSGDEVRDFPALRPHQRHPWYAFLTQIAAMALQNQGRLSPWDSAEGWRNSLMALTPEHADGAAWCLVSPIDRPAILQASVPEGCIDHWHKLRAADELDMLLTSKNHDLKAARMQRSTPEDWLFALVSLQTQEGFLGAGHYGISRMNGGFGNRPAVGVMAEGGIGRRWCRDLELMLQKRSQLIEEQGFAYDGGVGLVWLLPWDGTTSLAFSRLDPFYVEICRRIRLDVTHTGVQARTATSKVARINASERCGVTGDVWTPIDPAKSKALTISHRGFDYKLAIELLIGSKFRAPIAQQIQYQDGLTGLNLLMQGVTRGQGKTEGYHERRVPISPKVREALRLKSTDVIAKIANDRMDAIAAVRDILWFAMCQLFANGGSDGNPSRSGAAKVDVFVAPFERAEDGRFFQDLNQQIEAEQPQQVYEQWLLELAQRGEATLIAAFDAGPGSAMRRYRARASALNVFRGRLRSEKSKIPVLARLLKMQSAQSFGSMPPVDTSTHSTQ